MNKLIKLTIIITQVAAALTYVVIFNAGVKVVTSQFSNTEAMSMLRISVVIGLILQAISSFLRYRFQKVFTQTSDHLQETKRSYGWIALAFFAVAAAIFMFFVYNG